MNQWGDGDGEVQSRRWGLKGGVDAWNGLESDNYVCFNFDLAPQKIPGSAYGWSQKMPKQPVLV